MNLRGLNLRVMVTIRPATDADTEALAGVRQETWRAAYDGIIPADILARVTGDVNRNRGTFRPHPTRPLLTAVGPSDEVVGYASYGPERTANGTFGPLPGSYGPVCVAELYAIYVTPNSWSSGAGRALMEHVLDGAHDAGYSDISLWVLEKNERARRFYERAGFTLTGERQVLDGLGGVVEVRYARALQ
jgi:GNAT superfamily N-acetyltransferase